MESQPQNPEFRINPEIFYTFSLDKINIRIKLSRGYPNFIGKSTFNKGQTPMIYDVLFLD